MRRLVWLEWPVRGPEGSRIASEGMAVSERAEGRRRSGTLLREWSMEAEDLMSDETVE